MARPWHVRRPATLASLAAELGVSRTTVSNAYNRPDQLSPELRRRVLETARRLGYAGPDPVARSLRTRHAGAVGLLLTESLAYAFRDPAALRFLEGLTQACEEAGRGLLLVPAGGRTDTHGSPATSVHNAAVDGFVVYSVPDDDPHLAAVLQRPVPTVVCDQPVIAGMDRVGIDDRAAMLAITRHVLDLGHRRIGVLCMRLSADHRADHRPDDRADHRPDHGSDHPPGPADTGADGRPDLRADSRPDLRADSRPGVGSRPVSLAQAIHTASHVQRARLAGLRAALADADVDPGGVWLVDCPEHTHAAGEAGAAALLDHDPQITAIVCTSDVLALGALAEAARRRLDVPEALTVTGFDGVPEAERAGLTTVRQPMLEKGRLAGRLLLDGDSSGSRTVILETELVLGRTCAPPRRSQVEWFSGL